jgi:hypothetical protein
VIASKFLFWTCIAILVAPFLLAAFATLRHKFREIDTKRNADKSARTESARIRAALLIQQRELAAKTAPGKLAELRRAGR